MNRWMRHVTGALALALVLAAAPLHSEPAGRLLSARPRPGIITGQVGARRYRCDRCRAPRSTSSARRSAPSPTPKAGSRSPTCQPGPRTIRFQSVGYGTTDKGRDVEPVLPSTVNFQVREQAIAIDKVVITALGHRARREEPRLRRAERARRRSRAQSGGHVPRRASLGRQRVRRSRSRAVSRADPHGSSFAARARFAAMASRCT